MKLGRAENSEGLGWGAVMVRGGEEQGWERGWCSLRMSR